MNIFDLPQLPLTEEEVDVLFQNRNIWIERIISTGQVTDWYDQEKNEYVVLLEGNARIEYEDGKEKSLSKGDCLLIKPHEVHRVVYTSSEPPCIWLCIFF